MRLLHGYQKPILSLAVSIDGSRLYSAAFDQTMVWAWDLATASVVKKLRSHSNAYPRALACSPDGKWLLAIGENRGVTAWALPEGKLYPLGTNVTYTNSWPCVAFHPLGSHAAFNWTSGRGRRTDHGVQVWDWPSQRNTYVVNTHNAEVSAITFSPDGKLLALGCTDANVRLYENGTEVSCLRQRGVVSWLSFHPEGKLLAVSCVKATVVREPVTGNHVHTLTSHASYITGMGYSPDGKFLASIAADGVVMLFDAQTNEVLGQRHLEIGPLRTMCWLPDSSGLVAGGEKLIAVCDLADLHGTEHAKPRPRGEPVSLSGHEHRIVGLSYSPDGQSLCSWDQFGQVRMWDLSGGAGQAKPKPGSLSAPSHDRTSISWSPDSKAIAVAYVEKPSVHQANGLRRINFIEVGNADADFSRTFLVGYNRADELFLGGQDTNFWDIELWLELQDISGYRLARRTFAQADRTEKFIAFAPGGERRLYFAMQNGGVFLWDARSDTLTHLYSQASTITNLAISDDERQAVTTGGNSAFVWQLGQKGKPRVLKHPMLCSGATFLPGNRVITSCNDGLVRIWDAGSGTEMFAFDLEMGKVHSLAVSPDHMTFAAGVENGDRIVLMDVPE